MQSSRRYGGLELWSGLGGRSPRYLLDGRLPEPFRSVEEVGMWLERFGRCLVGLGTAGHCYSTRVKLRCRMLQYQGRGIEASVGTGIRVYRSTGTLYGTVPG